MNVCDVVDERLWRDFVVEAQMPAGEVRDWERWNHAAAAAMQAESESEEEYREAMLRLKRARVRVYARLRQRSP